MSTPAASAASKLASVLPGRDQVGALVADALAHGRVALTADIPGTSRSCGCRRPGRGRRIRAPHRGHGRPGRRNTRGSIAHPARARAESLHPRAHGSMIASASASLTPRRPPPRIDPRLPAALGLPDVPDPGDVALVEQRVADRPRLVVGAQPPQEARRVELARPARRARAPPAAGRSASGPRSAARAPARRTAPPRARARSTSHARRGERRHRRPARIHAPGAGHPQVRVDHAARPRSAGTDACRGSRPRHRASGEPLGPAVQRVARMRRADLVGHWPSSTGRIRWAA